MKFLTILFCLTVFINFCSGTELPAMRFVPGVDEKDHPESHRYDYICSVDSFPVSEKKYCYSEDGKLHFLFQKKPEHVNLFHEVGGEDPLEGFNRVSFSGSHFLMQWMFRPLGIVYTTIIPRPIVKAIHNVCDHVAYPKRLLSCLLQAKFNDAGISTTRFLFNSTVGVAGAWDASKYYFDMKKRDEDFGQAFASWGIGPGCYVFFPGIGPCNLRNAIGKIFDNAVDIKNFPLAYGAQTTAVSHRLLVNYEDYDRTVRTSADPYHTIKNFWYIHRTNKVKDHKLKFKHTEYTEIEETVSSNNLKHIEMDSYISQGVEVDTLKAMFFDIQKEKRSLFHYLSLFNTDFVTQGSSGSVKLHADKGEMDYHFWGQEENSEASLILLTPGFGAHHRSDKVLAMAESLHTRGFAVAAISSSFNWHFMETAASTDAPGFMAVDAGDTRKAWAKVIKKLRGNGIKPERIIMFGYSMGALHAMHIAKLEELQNTLGVDRYLAVNPPVDIIYAMKRLDNYYNTHRQWSEDELIKRGTVALGKMMALSKKQYARHNEDIPGMLPYYEDVGHPLNFEKAEAKFLIGYAFKITLQEMMLSMHRRGKLTHLQKKYKWFDKTSIHDESLRMTFQDYLKKVMTHHHKERFGKNVSDEEFMKKIAHHSHMKSFKKHFTDNPDIRIVHTKNDFLLHDESRKWLKEVFKEKIVFFEHGGHLGNLHFTKVHNQIYDFLQKTPVINKKQRDYHKKTYASLTAPYNIPSIPCQDSEFHNPL